MPRGSKAGAGGLAAGRLVLGTTLLFMAAIALPARARSAECGDAVSGQRVPCACGDVVVSDVRLRSDDPIVKQRCLLEGLIVRAPRTAESVRVDLAGLAIVGRGYGTGIRIDFGGSDGILLTGNSEASGQADARRGEIVGFSTGVVAMHPTALRRVESLRVRGNRRDGIKLHTDGTLVIDVESSDNGHHGFAFHGDGGRLQRVAANRNAGTGIHLRSSGVIVVGEAIGNRRNGIVSDGKENDIGGIVARENGERGVVVLGVRQRFEGIVSESNGKKDVLPTARGSGS